MILKKDLEYGNVSLPSKRDLSKVINPKTLNGNHRLSMICCFDNLTFWLFATVIIGNIIL